MRDAKGRKTWSEWDGVCVCVCVRACVCVRVCGCELVIEKETNRDGIGNANEAVWIRRGGLASNRERERESEKKEWEKERKKECYAKSLLATQEEVSQEFVWVCKMTGRDGKMEKYRMRGSNNNKATNR